MFGYGPRISQVFKSRWKAVTWSLGILLTAYCTVPAADDASQPDGTQASAAHKSPWAKS